ncbi:protein dachsous-like [Pecten maximus]|uniref:protein dachsous-like n=1 Tax=Pecten maximus TaxID=6579 RepID=UPI001458B177|nr:protein dachsous-like [Pecten maximus]
MSPYNQGITRVNNQPTVNNLPLTLNILESVAIGTVVFTLDVTEHDADDILNYVITYSPASAAAKFQFDTSTKQLMLVQGLDYESGIIQYTFGYTVDDGSLTAGPSTLTINVINDNEAPVIANEMYYITESENQNIGSILSITSADLIVTDPDIGDSLTYSIASGDPLEHFTIDATSGILTFAVRYDIDEGRMPAVVNLTIRVADKGGLSATAMIQVTLTDSNDNRPYFISDTFEANIPNDYPVRSSIMSVSAVDIDYTYNEIQYSLIDGDLQYFAVNEEGWIYLTKSVAEFYNYTTLSANSNGHYVYASAYILVSPALEDSFFNHTGNILWFTACVVAVVLIVILCLIMTYRYFRYGYACSPKKWSLECAQLRRAWQGFKQKLHEGANTCRAKWKAWRASRKHRKEISKPKKVVFSSEKVPKTAPPESKGRCNGFYRRLLSCLQKRKRPVERIQVARVTVSERNGWNLRSQYAGYV